MVNSMLKISFKNKLKRIGIGLVAAALVALSIPSTTFADKADAGFQITNARSQIMEEGKARVAANILYKCFKYNYNSVGDGFANSDHEGDDILDVNKIFYGHVAGVGLNGGAWYEKQNQGSVEDGFISCDEKGGKDVVKLFAQYVLGSADKYQLIYCTESGTPGTFHNKGQAGYCEGLGNSNKPFERSSNWESYLRGLYEDAAKANKWYDGSWDNIGYYDDYVGYGMYLQEIEYGCGKPVAESSPHSSNTLTYLDDTGAFTTQYISGDDSSYPVPDTNKRGNRYSFAEWGLNKTCNQIIGRASELAPSMQQKVFELIEANCKASYEEQRDLAQAVLDDPDAAEARKEVAQQQVDEFNGMTSYVQTVKNEEGNEGRECAEVEFLMQPIQESYDPFADEEDGGERGKMCMDNAGALGWIACTLADGLSNAIQGLYEKWVVPYLEVHASLFSTEGDATNIFNAWQIFQNFANLFFIGVLFFIIFSQITGYGIDNYGIKRTLPKLIVGAVLINTSFVISALAVDLSNILGIGIGNLFQGITKDITVASVSVDDASASGGGGIVTFAAGGAAVTALGLGLVTILSSGMASGPMLFYGGIALLIPILMGLLSIFLAVLFFFLLLCLRQALIVILVVVSPLAFACYMLTNTKPIFDKWFKAFKGALLAYPIASALVYGGQSIGSLLIAAEAGASGAGSGTVSVQMMLAAAVMSVAPIFLIPNAIKGSMSGLDAITKKMSGAVGGKANKLGSSAKERFAGSAFYQRAADSAQAAKNDKMMQKVRNRQHALEGKGANMNARERREYARNAAKLSADSNRIMGEYAEGYKNKTQSDIMGEFGLDKDGALLAAAGASSFASFLDKKGNFDVEKAAAALGSISDADKRHAAYAQLANNKAFQQAMGSAANREKIASVLSGKQGDLAGLAAAKNLLKWDGKDTDALISGASGSEFKSKMQNLGSSVMAGADKDTFAIEGIGDVLSDEQIKTGIGLGYSGSTATNFNNMLSTLDQDRRDGIAQTLSEDQIGGLSLDNLAALGGIQTKNADGTERTFKKASDFTEDEINAIRDKFSESTIQALGSDSGDAIRSKMNAEVIAALGIQRTKGPQEVIVIDHQQGNNGSGGGPSTGNAGDPQFGN